MPQRNLQMDILYVARSAPLNKQPTKDDNKIVVLDTNQGKIVNFLDCGYDPEHLDLTPDQTFLYA